jgi:asparagine synthase (glutamine-hydrolysing)
MCGIAGKIRYDGRPVTDSVRRMVARMRHRGPDHHDVVDIDEVAALGHSRLSILDLSPTGHQPMSDESGRFTITYNGEVYNFPALRRELTAAGFRFRGTSDTEVVLSAYIHLGPRAFDRFDGMFALAIWDRVERELVLCRDRFGEKPLYYALADSGEIAFASEASALLADEETGCRAAISIAGLNHYLALGYTLSPLTIYQNIAKLEPATFLRFREGRIREKTRYWDYRACFARQSRRPLPDLIDDVAALIEEAVRERLVSDVPVGAFLSGGVDSSAVAAIARRHLPYDLHTFTVGFAEPSYNESDDARLVADYLRTVHHEEVLRRRAAGPAWPAAIARAISSYDEPLSDTSLVPTVEVARCAARHVKVVLSGDGADEIFAGYPTYLADLLHRPLHLLPHGSRALLSGALSRAPLRPEQKTGLGFRLRQFGKGVAHDPRYAHYSWRELHNEEERIALIGPEHREEVQASHPFHTFALYYEEAEELDPLSQHLYVDGKTWLVDDILVKVDRATMASSLEARTPYLDRELVEYAASIPARFKLRGLRGKYVLKQALRRYLPAHTLRKRKAGFNAPIAAWLQSGGEDEFRFFNKYVAAHRGLLPTLPSLSVLDNNNHNGVGVTGA